ncbi:MAG: hypothetical protein ACOYO0_13150 [Sandarakinorhabdus sp.]|jgi:hypothetical protein
MNADVRSKSVADVLEAEIGNLGHLAAQEAERHLDAGRTVVAKRGGKLVRDTGSDVSPATAA